MHYDASIIGAGPIGLELAVGLKLANASYIHFDSGPIGATINWWAPGTRFFSSPERIAIAGVPMSSLTQDKATREEYLAYLRSIVQQFDLRINLFSTVQSVTRVDGGFELIAQSTSARQSCRSRNLILAIGDMHQPRLLNVPGENLPHVSHYLRDTHNYFRRRVLIVGGKNSAVEAAIRLYRVGAHVTLSYRGATFDPHRVKYWLRPELEWLISKNKIAFHPRTMVSEIDPQAVTLKSVDAQSGPSLRIEADDVLLLTGYVQDTSLFEQLGVELHGTERAPRFDSQTMQTNIPGVYVAGTAAAGTQRRARLFIENTHIHVRRIVRAVADFDLPWPEPSEYSSLAES